MAINVQATSGLEGIGAVITRSRVERAPGRKCARSWRVLPEVGFEPTLSRSVPSRRRGGGVVGFATSMTRPMRNAAIAFPLAIVVVLLDQAVKSWLLTGFHLAALSPAPLWGPIRLTLSFNNGVSFGFLRGDAPWAPYAFAGFALVVTIALAVWALRAPRPITALAIGFVMGGAVGNLVDRIARGAVVDFIDASALHFPWVFNLADSAITVGVALLLLESFVGPKAAA